MKILKKAAAILLAGALMLGTAVTAFASSPETSSSQAANITATAEAAGITATAQNAYGRLRVTISNNYTEKNKEAAEDIATDPTAVLNELGLDPTGMVFKAVMNVAVEGADVGETITVTFSVPNVTAGSTVYVLQYIDGAWKQVKAVSLGDGTVTIEYAYQVDGPFAIYVDQDTAAAGSSSGSTGTTTSPKTGEAPVMAGIILAAGLAAAGMVIYRKKARV